MPKNLRTPIIMPRKQGGTFYTFSSAMEDIGLNVNESHNRVELSHYVLLNIPSFTYSSNTEQYDGKMYLSTDSSYEEQDQNQGDFIFAESFQDYCLNMEALLRNQDNYNYASNKTVSERVFWKWFFDHIILDSNETIFVEDNGYYYENSDNPENRFVKGFGSISAGTQRTDDSGLYNETFVQIPSSYGQMKVLFKKSSDENYKEGETYTSTEQYIQNIDSTTELEDNVLKSTGISAIASYDSSIESSTGGEYTNDADKPYDGFEVEFDIDKLRDYYDSQTLTYDDLGIGDNSFGNYTFNAILVYYSIYDLNKTKRLATNAYGLYILDTATKDQSNDIEFFNFPSLLKKKSTETESGSSYSFRINIKPSTAYSGDIKVSDNSTAAYSMSEDFNDVLRNLTSAVTSMKSNAKTLYKIVRDNEDLKQFALSTVEKIDNIESEISSIKNGNVLEKANHIYKDTGTSTTNLTKDTAKQIISNTTIKQNNSGDLFISINTEPLTGTALKIAEKMQKELNGKNTVDMLSLLMILITATKE